MLEILKSKMFWISGISGLILGWVITYSILTSNENSKFDEIFQSGQDLGYFDAIEDVRNSKIKVWDDKIMVIVHKNANPDSTQRIMFNNPTFFIKGVEE